MRPPTIVQIALISLTVMAPVGPIYPDSEKLPARAGRECRALRESGTRDSVFLGYRKARTVLFRCQPSGRAVLKQRSFSRDKKKRGRESSH